MLQILYDRLTIHDVDSRFLIVKIRHICTSGHRIHDRLLPVVGPCLATVCHVMSRHDTSLFMTSHPATSYHLETNSPFSHATRLKTVPSFLSADCFTGVL